MVELNSLPSAGIPQPLPRGVDRRRVQLQEVLLLGFERVFRRRPLLAHPCRRLRAGKPREAGSLSFGPLRRRATCAFYQTPNLLRR
jgi:hypothetical protein